MKQDFNVPSSDGIHTLAGVVYLPEGGARGYFHVVHGMNEHMGRYDSLMTMLCEAGYICFGYDHLGHGRTARDKSELGYIAKKRGAEYLCRDVKVFSDAVFGTYGTDHQKRLPYYLMGHSMGSFITRIAIEKYVKPDKYICMGTGGRNAAALPGLALIGILKLFRGDHTVSPLIYKLVFGSYNNRFGGYDKRDYARWLTADETVRERYYADPYCAYWFSLSAMGDLVRLNRDANRAAWYQKLPHIPMLLIAGDMDPVGNYGKGVRQVHRGLVKRGHDVTCILYEGARHEILNDISSEQTRRDILAFVQA